MITNDKHDAMKIVRDFAEAIASAYLYSNEARQIAADYIETPKFLSENEQKEVIQAFVHFLRTTLAARR